MLQNLSQFLIHLLHPTRPHHRHFTEQGTNWFLRLGYDETQNEWKRRQYFHTNVCLNQDVLLVWLFSSRSLCLLCVCIELNHVCGVKVLPRWQANGWFVITYPSSSPLLPHKTNQCTHCLHCILQCVPRLDQASSLFYVYFPPCPCITIFFVAGQKNNP